MAEKKPFLFIDDPELIPFADQMALENNLQVIVPPVVEERGVKEITTEQEGETPGVVNIEIE